MKELNFNELTTRQKIGMTMVGCLTMYNENNSNFDDEMEYLLGLIRERCLGAIWVDVRLTRREEVMAAVKEAADYPILIITDAENGFGEYMIGKKNSIGVAGREDLAYTFGKVIGVEARKMGYNVNINFGNPANYVGRGFVSCKKKNVSFIFDGNFPTALLVCELIPDSLDGRKWMYIPSTAADCCEDSVAVEAFDATFPPKEKTWMPSQEEFYIYSHSSVVR